MIIIGEMWANFISIIDLSSYYMRTNCPVKPNAGKILSVYT